MKTVFKKDSWIIRVPELNNCYLTNESSWQISKSHFRINLTSAFGIVVGDGDICWSSMTKWNVLISPHFLLLLIFFHIFFYILLIFLKLSFVHFADFFRAFFLFLIFLLIFLDFFLMFFIHFFFANVFEVFFFSLG